MCNTRLQSINEVAKRVTGSGDLLVLRFRVKKPGAKIEDANLRFESLMINEKSVISQTVGR